MITYQFRLFPTRQQLSLFKKQLEQHRLLYNNCLESKKTAHQEEKKSITCFDLIKSHVSQYKEGCNYSSLQQTVRRLDKAYKSFFRKSGFPRFKSKNAFNTIEYAKHGDGCKFKDNILYLQHIGKIKCKSHRQFSEKIKTLSVTLKNNTLYVNVICEKFYGTFSNNSNSVGIDFGISNTITTSDGESHKTPHFLKNKLKDIARLNRQKVKNPKAKKALAKIYSKLANQRKDFNHKLSKRIIEQYGIICLEDLKVKKIVSFKNVNRRLFDIGINQLMQFISYKAESAGKKVVFVDPAYTSQTCFNCGSKKELSLKDREYICVCGYTEDRDINAAKNIERLGLQSLVNT